MPGIARTKPQRWAPVSEALVAPEWGRIASHIKIGFPLWDGSGAPYDYAYRRVGTKGAGAIWRMSPYGRELDLNGGATAWVSTGALDQTFYSGGFTIVVMARHDSAAVDGGIMGCATSPANQAGAMQFWRDENGGTDRLGIAVRNAAAAYQVQYGAFESVLGKYYLYIWSSDGTLHNVWVDGVRYITDWSQAVPAATVATRFGCTDGTDQKNLDGGIALAYVLDIPCTPSEAQRITRDPFGPFRLWLPALGRAVAAPVVGIRQRTLLGVGI